MKLGDLIKYLRESKGFSQQQLADKAEISRSVLSQYENNLVDPTAYVVKRLATILEVSTDYLLGLEDDFGGKTTEKAAPGITAEERQLIEDYRALNAPGKQLIKTTMHTLLDTAPAKAEKKKAIK